MQDCCQKLGRMAALAVVVFLGCELVAQTTFPTVYVSTGAGQQILALAVTANSATIAGLCSVNLVPEDVVVGPDGKLYIANTTGNSIYRMASMLPAPSSTAASCTLEKIYDTTATCTGLTSSTCPTGPEGPSFLHINTLDLYFNTHGNSQGVWKIPGIASIAACGTA